jgi:hypothetical protein
VNAAHEAVKIRGINQRQPDNFKPDSGRSNVLKAARLERKPDLATAKPDFDRDIKPAFLLFDSIRQVLSVDCIGKAAVEIGLIHDRPDF